MKQKLQNDAAIIRAAARPIAHDADFDSLVHLAGAARCVLIGEASHGTHEFYETRGALTKRLIEEKGFHGVGSGLARQLSRPSLRHWPWRRPDGAGSAERFSPLPILDVAQHRSGRVRRMVAGLERPPQFSA